MLEVPLALLPVLAFLVGLRVLDSFALLRKRDLARGLLIGAMAALFSVLVNPILFDRTGLDAEGFRRYLAPLVEELAKGIFVAWLVLTSRVGFLVDAAIVGFAVGAGFAVVENVFYLRELSDANLWLWVVRGFGTAVMHGSTTSILAMSAKALSDRYDARSVAVLLPGLTLAYAVHAVFNHFWLHPLASTLLILVSMPLLMLLTFDRSEQATRDWLGRGFDTDTEFLEVLLSPQLPDSKVGRYLQSLRQHLPPEMVVDMLCLLRLHLELSVRAKGILLAREAGVQIPIGEDVRAKLDELRVLERSVGPTGRLALHPIRRVTSRELWELYVLER